MTHEYFENLRIVELRLENFRSFARARLSLDDLTFIVGRNAAGKSNLLDALEFLRECLLDGPVTALRRRGELSGVRWHGAAESAPVGVSVVLRGHRMGFDDEQGSSEDALYGFRLRPGSPVDIEEVFLVPAALDLSYRRRGRSVTYVEPNELTAQFHTPSASVAPSMLALVEAGGSVSPAAEARFELERLRAHQLAPSAIATPAETRSETALARTGENAADIVANLAAESGSEIWPALLRSLSRVCHGVVDVKTRNFGPKVYLNFVRQNGQLHEFGAEHASAGTLRALGVLLALAQQPTPSLVAIDEIEDSFHPGAFNLLIGEAEAASRQFPVVLTTHSPEVLSHPSASAARIRVVEWRDGRSEIYRLNDRTAAAVGPLDSVGDLLRENALGLSESPDVWEGDLLEL